MNGIHKNIGSGIVPMLYGNTGEHLTLKIILSKITVILWLSFTIDVACVNQLLIVEIIVMDLSRGSK